MAVRWIFDAPPASGARHGGLAQAEVFNKDVDTFIREVLQNARDQQRDPDEPVRVRFRLEEISGADLDSFLSSLCWEDLAEHLDGVAEQGYVTISPRIAEGLSLIRRDGRLRILRIDDRGTRGLTGDEDETQSNFNMLCRHTLITGGDRRTSGGSFGLGKSVLWRFSNLSTVLFSSGVTEPSFRPRFFGRSLLAWHEARGSEWEGSGWLGAPETRPAGERAISIWDDEARETSRALAMDRGVEDDGGTTILILGFDDPSVEDEPDIAQHCQAFVESAARWFWPALLKGQMEIVVEGIRDDIEIFRRQVLPTPEVNPFVAAEAAQGPFVDRLGTVGDVVEQPIPLRVPPQRPGSVSSPRAAANATGVLRLRVAETGETDHPNTIALQRGSGMVIRYYEPPGGGSADVIFHGSLRVGRALGDSASNLAAEEFLRAAEPVAHSEWVGTTERVKHQYHGAAAGLREFHDALNAAVRLALRDSPPADTEGPEALRRFFPLPGIGGGSTTREPYRLSGPFGFVDADGWSFGGVYSSSADQDRDWAFRVALQLEQESGEPGENLPIEGLKVSAGRAQQLDGRPDWEVTVPAGVQRVQFSGRSGYGPELPAGGIRRALVQLNVRPARRRGDE
jgi:hypothetical protein